MRYLWWISGAMFIGGVMLAVAGAVAGMGPIALLAGVLLAWSAVVKIIVLRIWQKVFQPVPATPRPAPAIEWQATPQ
jgi:hypothetical protein